MKESQQNNGCCWFQLALILLMFIALVKLGQIQRSLEQVERRLGPAASPAYTGSG